MALAALIIFAVICSTIGYGEEKDYDIQYKENYPKHKYPPYFFTKNYFPKFSAWLRKKDNIYQDIFQDSFEHFEDEADENNDQYSDKTQLRAFLFAFFLGLFGAGRFYSKLYLSATFKLILGIMACGPCIFDCFFNCITTGQCNCKIGMRFGRGTDHPPLYIQAFQCVKCCAGLSWFIWWIIDLVLFGINDIHDGNGFVLKPW